MSSAGHNQPLFVVGLRQILFPGGQENQSSDDHSKLLEAIALLERRGLVVRECSYSEPRMPSSNQSYTRQVDKSIVSVYLTSIGMKSDFDDEILLLVDRPQEIVGTLEQEIGTLDNVVRQYYLESLRAYQEGLYISSVICLGAASERAIHWLAETIESYSETYQKEIKKRRDGSIFRLTEYLSNSVIPNIFEGNHDLKDRLDRLASIYRENRNEAGHPKNVVQNWSREDQHILLFQFRRYITTICKAIEECRTNNKPTTTNG